MPPSAAAGPAPAGAPGTDAGPHGVTRHEHSRDPAPTVGPFFDLSSDLMCVVSSRGEYVRVNPEMCRTIGRPAEDLVGSHFTTGVHPEDVALLNAYRDLFRTGVSVPPFTVRYVSPGGGFTWVTWTRRVTDPAGLTYAVGRDVTKTRATDAALRETEAKLRALTDSMPQIVWSADATGYHDYFNERWYDYTGMSRSGDQGWNWKDYLHPDDFDRTLSHWNECLSTGKPYEVEYRFRRARDGAYRWFMARAVPIRDDDGSIVRWFGTCTDMHEQRLAQEERARLLEQEHSARTEAERVSAMKDEFLATLSHELRTPLNSVLGWAQMLRSGRGGQERLLQGLETIERNVRVQTALIDDLLDMSRILSGKMRLSHELIDVKTVLDAAAETVRFAAEAKGIRLRTSVECDALPRVMADPARLQQVFWNLLSNAVKFTGRDGSVDASVRTDESRVVVDVRDNGRGIPTEFVPRVFERFSQVDSASNRSVGGLGLGLAIVRHLTELHGGTVSVTSEGPGRGSSFSVFLPVVSVARTDVYDGRELVEGARIRGRSDLGFLGAAELSGVKVLVVDDEPDARQLVRYVLEEVGAEVSTAGSADEAFGVIPSFRPDVILSDLGMPVKDGYELMRNVRSLGPEEGGRTPAVALSAYARDLDRRKARDVGYHGHVAKPVEPTELVAVLACVIGHAPHPALFGG